MSDGWMAFKGLAWGAGALIVAATVVPADQSGQWNPLRTAKKGGRTQTCWDGSVISGTATCPTQPTTTPTPTPTPTTTTTNSAYPELTMIPSNFDINSELVPAAVPPLATDLVGAFRFICNAGQVLRDDPIV